MSSPLPPDQWPSRPGAEHFGDDPDDDTGPIHVEAPEGTRDDPGHLATQAAGYSWKDAPGYPVTQVGYLPSQADGGPIAGPGAVHSEPFASAETAQMQWPSSYQPPGQSYAGHFAAPLTVDPRSIPLKGNRFRHLPLIAGVAAVLIAGLTAWLLWPSSDDPSTSAAGSTSTTAPTATVSPEQRKLLGILPPGYSSTACTQADLPTEAVASVECERNSDAGGPTSATYTMYADKGALKSGLDAVVRDTRIVNCPGNIQSPGPWRRNATPQQAAGTLLCGLRDNVPKVAWTDDASLVLSTVEGAQGGPDLDQLYVWWSSHS